MDSHPLTPTRLGRLALDAACELSSPKGKSNDSGRRREFANALVAFIRDQPADPNCTVRQVLREFNPNGLPLQNATELEAKLIHPPQGEIDHLIDLCIAFHDNTRVDPPVQDIPDDYPGVLKLA